nr:hypothetical protein Iba_chr08cCG8170 [Ipomoea batatas]GMD27059.1 hypothetical protein Iba_chr08dCG10140 [Ipomoea batatas]
MGKLTKVSSLCFIDLLYENLLRSCCGQSINTSIDFDEEDTLTALSSPMVRSIHALFSSTSCKGSFSLASATPESLHASLVPVALEELDAATDVLALEKL